MQHRFTWKGIEYDSLENCTVHISGETVEIHSEIVGAYDHSSYRVLYTILLNQSWEMVRCSLEATLDGQHFRWDVQRIASQRWSLNGLHRPELDGCTEVDIPLTPLTNSLPVNRLRLKLFQEVEIKVIYLDVLAQEVRLVRQKYRKLSAMEYQYENIPNDFEALVKVDEEGFVVDYPSLFVRIDS